MKKDLDGNALKVKDIERRQCGRCGLIGDWKVYMDGSRQQKCPHCGKTSGYGSAKIS